MVLAICKILYVFCKIRGSKVICRFLSNEPQHLVILIQVFEDWQRLPSKTEHEASLELRPLEWQERYILLVWTSHLLLTPFNLDSLASASFFGNGEALTSHVQRLQLPPNLPGIAVMITRNAISQMQAASKERDAAVTVLVRLCTRPDMHRLGVDEALVHWIIGCLQREYTIEGTPSGYWTVGLLSFLGHLMKAVDAVSTASFVLFIFNKVKALDLLDAGKSSAMARTATVKLLSAIARTSLHLDRGDNLHGFSIADHVLEDIINNLLAALADSDTPVRQAASKALSIITLSLDRSMAAEVSEAVIAGLEDDVLWDNVPETTADGSHVSTGQTIRQRNLTAVNPIRWQGLVLTLSHLLFRKAPPITQLPAILNCLIIALSFEQRSPSGASLGSNVRDAACFGIWSLVRKYTTSELSAVDLSVVPALETDAFGNTVLQMLGIELLTTAILDPSGNIRRGASAALQELIGRHPDAVERGIEIVQVVDYRAVGLRSRALTEVSVKAARLGQCYWRAILASLMTWRGIGATDVESRRLSAEAIGLLVISTDQPATLEVLSRLWQSLNFSDRASVPERQGFLLAAAEVVRVSNPFLRRDPLIRTTVQRLWGIFSEGLLLAEEDFVSSTSRPELTAEGACCLIAELANACNEDGAVLHVPNRVDLDKCLHYTNLALERSQAVAIQSASEAAKSLLDISPVEIRALWLQGCVQKCRESQKANTSGSFGHITALGYVWSGVQAREDHNYMVLEAITSTSQVAFEIDVRIAAVRSLKNFVKDSSKSTSLDPSIC